MPSVAVVGGSLGGLTAALVLRDAGCEVCVYERSPDKLRARGAGIAVLDQTLRYPVERLHMKPEEISTRTEWVRFLLPDGSVRYAEPRRYRFSAWNTIYRALHTALDEDSYRLGWEMTEFTAAPPGVDVGFADGQRRVADLLVCADGINSTARQQLFPNAASQYAGYVCWRGVVPEADLTGPTFDALHDALTYQVLPNSHILVYPIPADDGSVQPGERLINMVWYRNVTGTNLPDFMSDRHGTQHGVSVPPGHVRDEAIAQMRQYAARHLAEPIAEVTHAVAEPFVQAVFDIEVPRMRKGRACLIGDAAFAVRPHAAAGTAKAAEDGWVLAEELTRANGDVGHALDRWEERQLALGTGLLERTRRIGDCSQFEAGFRPDDPELVFGLYGPGH